MTCIFIKRKKNEIDSFHILLLYIIFSDNNFYCFSMESTQHIHIYIFSKGFVMNVLKEGNDRCSANPTTQIF